jgi:hypothetical protein
MLFEALTHPAEGSDLSILLTLQQSEFQNLKECISNNVQRAAGPHCPQVSEFSVITDHIVCNSFGKTRAYVLNSVTPDGQKIH